MSGLSDALKRLEREVVATKTAPAAESYTQVAERDEDHRITRVVVTHSDGRVFHKVPRRDEDMRIVEVVVTEQPRP